MNYSIVSFSEAKKQDKTMLGLTRIDQLAQTN